MKIVVFVLAVVSGAFGGSKEELQDRIGECRDHYATSCLSEYYLVIHQGEHALSGFGRFQVSKDLEFDVQDGHGAVPEKFHRDDCAYEGRSCFWLEFAGGKTMPENTDSISINGISGIPDRGTWRFTLAQGTIDAFSHLPFGDPDSAVVDGKG